MHKRPHKSLTKAILVSVLLLAPLAAVIPAEPQPAPRAHPERLRWWADARFGMFIHWGPVSLRGTEISWSRAARQPHGLSVSGL